MPYAVEASCREDLRRASLSGQGVLVRLLALLRTAPEPHLGLAEVVLEVARQLETLADHGLLRRLLSTANEPVFDTVTEPHFHVVYEETAQIVDLQVSPETLLAILRQALAERPDRVEILVRFRGDPAPVVDQMTKAGPDRRRRTASRA